MALWTLVVWVVIGAAAGLLARKILGGTPPFGTTGDVILGMAGSVVGGYIVALLGASGTGGIIGSFIAALAGALLLIWLSKLIKK
ncbi:MAG: GlsB/YeaQ/YmgE family stress response membrane protein [Pseudomonadota bacterium]|nr:GlsB/YeaQ/YmgE family stress response membrane protein [Pseudomonadota bacterium]